MVVGLDVVGRILLRVAVVNGWLGVVRDPTCESVRKVVVLFISVGVICEILVIGGIRSLDRAVDFDEGGGIATAVAGGAAAVAAAADIVWRHDNVGDLGLVGQVADHLDRDVVQFVWRAIAVVGVCSQRSDLV